MQSGPAEAKYVFPTDFVWGAAAAAYQIEGAATADDKGASVWDMFCERQGAIDEGHTGAVACDHYHRYAEDVELMSQLGLNGYRLSISWPRVMPDGTGQLSRKGLAFYDRLIDGLLEKGIVPWVTLFHWDYPLALFHRGGWLNPDSSDWFAEYAEKFVARFADRVTNYFTLNEPQVFIGFGHLEGVHAPGLNHPIDQMLLAGHNALLAHGKAVLAMRAASSHPIKVGCAPVIMPKLPTGTTEPDIELARRATFTIFKKDSWNNAWWLDPILLGNYPEQGLEYFGRAAPKVSPGDMEIIATPTDFIGLNIYQGSPVRASASEFGFEVVPHPVGGARTAFNWPITPEALYWGPKFIAERYKKPIYITENGLSCRDWVAHDGKVHDESRIDFTCRYLRALHQAIEDGTDVRGYFHWSIMDNFEWAAGYRERFGLIHVDYETQKRTPKESYHWYRKVIESNGAELLK